MIRHTRTRNLRILGGGTRPRNPLSHKARTSVEAMAQKFAVSSPAPIASGPTSQPLKKHITGSHGSDGIAYCGGDARLFSGCFLRSNCLLRARVFNELRHHFLMIR